MSFIMPEIVVQRVIQEGIKSLRANPDAFNDIFATLMCDEMNAAYGQAYIDKIRNWFFTTKIPVLQAWSLNPQRIPCISVHLATEMEDEQKAAIGDYFGDAEDSTTLTGVFTVYVDIGIHADKSSDGVLWLYYIVSYIMFKEKRRAERLGLKLHTWNASDYSRDNRKLAEDIWTRWMRFKCTTQNFLADETLSEAESVVTNISAQPAGSDDPDDVVDVNIEWNDDSD